MLTSVFAAENTDGPILRNFIHPQVGEVPQSDSAYLSPFIVVSLTCLTYLGVNRRLGLSWARRCGHCDPFVTTLERLNVALLYPLASIVHSVVRCRDVVMSARCRR